MADYRKELSIKQLKEKTNNAVMSELKGYFRNNEKELKYEENDIITFEVFDDEELESVLVYINKRHVITLDPYVKGYYFFKGMIKLL